MKESDMNILTVGEIVAHDHRAASIFKEAGIDFCCGGKKSLTQACSEKNIDPDQIIAKLNEILSTPNTTTHNYNEWDPVFLCDYIVNTHHKYVLKTLPDLVFYTEKLAKVHGDRHPELLVVATLFSQVSNELNQHLKNEEQVLFPAIKELFSSGSELAAKTVQNEISRLSAEHEFAGGAIDRINEITQNYLIPADGCNTYRVGFKMLQEFEDDLHVHVHLENNILFPKALDK
jgi:regulator of cell morphogenesis and NO signaling